MTTLERLADQKMFGKLIEAKNGVAIIHRPTVSNNDVYAVTHYNVNNYDDGFYWSTYDLDFESAVNLFHEKTAKKNQ